MMKAMADQTTGSNPMEQHQTADIFYGLDQQKTKESSAERAYSQQKVKSSMQGTNINQGSKTRLYLMADSTIVPTSIGRAAAA
jgi:hypothetical protein